MIAFMVTCPGWPANKDNFIGLNILLKFGVLLGLPDSFKLKGLNGLAGPVAPIDSVYILWEVNFQLLLVIATDVNSPVSQPVDADDSWEVHTSYPNFPLGSTPTVSFGWYVLGADRTVSILDQLLKDVPAVINSVVEFSPT